MTTDIKPSRAALVDRATAINRLGVSYAHEGSFRNPVRELLGRREHNFDPLSECSLFDAEGDALAHVRALARDEAGKQLSRTATFFEDGSLKFRLWLARNWAVMRRREVGILATHAIMDKARRDYDAIARSGLRIDVVRLADSMRLPAVIDLETPVWVLDTSAFPKADISLREDRIIAWSFVDLQHHPDYDVLIRYRLADTVGSFGYDFGDADSEELQSTRSDVAVFLSESAARRKLSMFAHDTRQLLERAGPYALLLPPPSTGVATLTLPPFASTEPLRQEVAEATKIELPAPAPVALTAEAADPSASPAPNEELSHIDPSLEAAEVALAEVPAHPAPQDPSPTTAAPLMGAKPRPWGVYLAFTSRLGAVARWVSAAVKGRLRPSAPRLDAPSTNEAGPELGAPLLREFVGSGLKIRRPEGVTAESSLTQRALELIK